LGIGRTILGTLSYKWPVLEKPTLTSSLR